MQVQAIIPTQYLLLTGDQAAFVRAQLLEPGTDTLIPNQQVQEAVTFPEFIATFDIPEGTTADLKYYGVSSAGQTVGDVHRVNGVSPHLVPVPQG